MQYHTVQQTTGMESDIMVLLCYYSTSNARAVPATKLGVLGSGGNLLVEAGAV